MAISADAPLLAVLGASEPSSPRLTWYGADGERIELSGRVLVNWMTKAANLLATECGIGQGSRVLIDLPAHWRLLVWAAAAQALGSSAGLADRDAAPDAGGDVVVSDRPDRWVGVVDELVAVPLPALARAWPGPLPTSAIDGAAELMGQPDVPVFAVPTVRAGVPSAGERRLLVAESAATLVADAEACWRKGGSVVVVEEGVSTPLARIAEQEGVTPG